MLGIDRNGQIFAIVLAFMLAFTALLATPVPKVYADNCVWDYDNGCLTQWTMPLSVHECDLNIYHWKMKETKQGGEYVTGTFKWYISDGGTGWILYNTHVFDFGWMFKNDEVDVFSYMYYDSASAGPGRVELDLSNGVNLAENKPTIINEPAATC